MFWILVVGADKTLHTLQSISAVCQCAAGAVWVLASAARSIKLGRFERNWPSQLVFANSKNGASHSERAPIAVVAFSPPLSSSLDALWSPPSPNRLLYV